MPNNLPFIVSAYALTWAVLIGYAWHLTSARRDAGRRLESAARESAPAPAPRESAGGSS
ncbi:MAG: hypothetical protein ABIZ91_13455 [Gemmatimonadaceae bacterium]